MSHNYQCSTRNCRKRITLPKELHKYVRKKVCVSCGGNLKLDRSTKKRNKLRKCLCDGVHFPHHKGTIIDEREYCRYGT